MKQKLLNYPNSVHSLYQTMQEGKAKDGAISNLVTLTNNKGMTATFMDIGATWLSCTVPLEDSHREILLGIDTLEKFYQQKCYLGATVGRFANRINNGKFSIDGVEYHLNKNHERYCLHGGIEGFDQRRWSVELQSTNQVIYSLISPDGDQGFPGELDVSVSYRLTEQNEVEISYHAFTTKTTPINLTNHAYFNLDGHNEKMDCRQHELLILAEKFLPTDEYGIPLNQIDSVENKGLDFRSCKLIGQDFLTDPEQRVVGGYDHSYLFDFGNNTNPNVVAKAASSDYSIVMKVKTTQPALQFYSGNFLNNCPGRKETVYKNYSGFALETQCLPDSPNHPEWSISNTLLQPGQPYRHKTIYQFVY
ncbi:galactose-1-epimerase [Vibrio sp. CK2-1]|uniref:galactose-1-epimerase n=1 Tax=Vibrio sp. CK2-1 TaxID=2912249 RepID=UPI001F0002CC|nr:galactose-1-epimerase [Vibrio sp. CK2-1]MCF7352943.1 galactose-1-epimerase [Vibrio sp. CK2-1]